jgi:hypothetical protein
VHDSVSVERVCREEEGGGARGSGEGMIRLPLDRVGASLKESGVDKISRYAGARFDGSRS